MCFLGLVFKNSEHRLREEKISEDDVKIYYEANPKSFEYFFQTFEEAKPIFEFFDYFLNHLNNEKIFDKNKYLVRFTIYQNGHWYISYEIEKIKKYLESNDLQHLNLDHMMEMFNK